MSVSQDKVSATYLQLSYHHTDDAEVWSWLMVLCCYNMLYLCEGKTLLHTRQKKNQILEHKFIEAQQQPSITANTCKNPNTKILAALLLGGIYK